MCRCLPHMLARRAELALPEMLAGQLFETTWHISDTKHTTGSNYTQRPAGEPGIPAANIKNQYGQTGNMHNTEDDIAILKNTMTNALTAANTVALH